LSREPCFFFRGELDFHSASLEPLAVNV
jgi:hypothetical protein